MYSFGKCAFKYAVRMTRIEYAAECDLLNAYFGEPGSASSQIVCAISRE